MPSPLNIALFATAISLTGWLVIPRLTRSINSAAHRTRFRHFIICLIEKTRYRFSGEFAYYHPEKTVAEFDGEVLNVKGHIPKRHLLHFDKACRDYRGVQFTVTNTQANEAAKAQLISILERFLIYAK